MKLASLLLCLVTFAVAKQRSYNGYKVVRSWPQSIKQLYYLKEKLNHGEDSFWSEPTLVGKSVDIMVPAEKMLMLQTDLQKNYIKNEIAIEDVGRLIHQGQKSRFKTQTNSFDFEDYYQRDDIYTYLDELENQHSDIMSQEVIGRSYEGVDIRLVKLSTGCGKRAVWIDGGIHAREWIAPAVNLYLLTHVLEDGTLLEKFDFYFIPIVNPDGYEYSHTNDRMWRKNRRPSDSGTCYGVDLNRNFDNHFGGSGTSGSPCSDIYRGESAFSEPETQAFRDAVMARKDDIELLITLHSYSQFVMVPYGYAVPPEYPDDFDQLLQLAQASEEVLRSVHGKEFTVANSAEIYGAAAGATDDWAKQTVGIKYVYTVELRDTGSYGFMLPANQIIPSGQEMMAFIREACAILSA